MSWNPSTFDLIKPLRHTLLQMLRCMACCLLLSLFVACHHEEAPEASFYHWKTTVTLSDTEQTVLRDLQVKQLYLRLFDIDKDPATGAAVPVGVTSGLDKIPANQSVIPVVFITNRTFTGMTNIQADSLANRALHKIMRMCKTAGLTYHEVQFDCDWSDQTREPYFFFLQKIRSALPKDVTLSATIRLHQVKYRQRTGIPPVDRGMLMFYNMGQLDEASGRNSIYNTVDAAKYVGYAKSYPLVLDVALPAFQWLVQYRKGKVVHLVVKEHMPDVQDTSHFVADSVGKVYTVRVPFLYNGLYMQQDDKLRLEQVPPDTLVMAAGQLNRCLSPGKRRVVFFDLDPFNIHYYGIHTFEKTLAVFN